MAEHLQYSFKLFWLFNVFYLCIASEHNTDSVIERKLSSRIVNTKYGALRGYIATLPESSIQEVEVFLGVPYANPPTGKLRFMPPVSLAPWNGIRLAHTLSPVCPQNLPNKSSTNLKNDLHSNSYKSYWRVLEFKNLQRMLRNQSEDCLYLNIYSPLGNKSETFKSRPVLVYIHGESFEWGAGSVFDGTALAAYGDIIVVTINYRLGALGFFPSLDETSRGNFGLMDQVAALHWLQENIQSFNGDPNNVTLMGQGSGAVSCHLLMISSMAKGLFHKVIMQSGSAYSPWALSQNALKYAYQLIEKLDCSQSIDLTKNHISSNSSNEFSNSKSNSQIMQCLRSKKIENLLEAQRKIQVPIHLTAFGPTIDGLLVINNHNNVQSQSNSNAFSMPLNQNFLLNSSISSVTSNSQTNSFTNILNNGLGSMPLLIGLSRLDMRWNEFENIFSLMEDLRNPLLLREKALSGLIRSLYSYHLNEIYLTVANEYTDWSKNSVNSLLDGIIEILSDATIGAPLVKTALLHSRLQRIRKNLSTRTSNFKNDPSSTYFYCFSYIPETPSILAQEKVEPTHGLELAYLFGHPLLSNGTVGSLGYFPNRKYTKEEQFLSRQIINYWTNFAKTGNPNNGHVGSSQVNLVVPFWPPYDEQQQQYMSISPKSKVRDNYHAHRLSFWLNLVPKLHAAGALDNKIHLINSLDHHYHYDMLQNNYTSSTTSAASLLDSFSYNSYLGQQSFTNENNSMQKTITQNKNNQKSYDKSTSNNDTRVHNSQLEHYTQKQPSKSKSFENHLNNSSNINYIVNIDHQNSLKHSFKNREVDSLNFLNSPVTKQGEQIGNAQVISFEQARNEQKIFSYYSKALMLTIIVGILMFALNVSIFIILMNRKRKQDSKKNQLEDNKSLNQKNLQLSSSDHHLKMIKNDEHFVQYEDYHLEHSHPDQLKKSLENKASKNSIYNLRNNLQHNSLTLQNSDTDLKWYTTSNGQHNNQSEHHLPLNVSNWTNNYLLFEQHPESNDLTGYAANTLTNIDLNTLAMTGAIDTLSSKIVNEVGTSNFNPANTHFVEHDIKMTTAIKHHNETDI